MDDEKNHSSLIGVPPVVPRRTGGVKATLAICILAALILFVGIAAYFWKSTTQPMPSSQAEISPDYYLEGVPPVTIYNHVGDVGYINNDSAAALLSVLKYYGDDFTTNELTLLNAEFFDGLDMAKRYSPNLIKKYAEELGYDAEWVRLATPTDVKAYINENGGIPLIFSQVLSVGQEIDFFSVGVLVGVSGEEEQISVHHYYWGFDKVLSFAEWDALWAAVRENHRHMYLAIKPKPTSRITPHVPELRRTANMAVAEPIINDLTLGRVALIEGNFDVALAYGERALAHPDFESVVPPYYKIVAYALVAGMTIRDKDFNFGNKDLQRVEDLTQRAERENVDLDKPFSDFWPGFVDNYNGEIGVLDSPYLLRGLLHIAQGEYSAAVEAFDRALAIWPHGMPTIVSKEYAESRLKSE